ncbi:MgtC/SapB family protein [Carboxylicivirga linearis]|uniref:MgtC/SapB family protein n=1 Tax=Carboxylicivirga linearis TaxID=1628157 RepID=A0ABS5JTJ9_9BACT|nr:MgtC/SapB family protein [Carboxylicivirga linearis]MBS2098172.1 MgtC/SapB family protein [Carboxylicivirga linearis]
MSIQDFIIRLAFALVGGFIIGFERGWHHKSAGLRTNTLVAVGSALFVMLSINLTQEKGDVTRIVAQVVSGIGFLGAGIIFKEGLTVHGLTTAATVWCSSAIGCLAAAGYYIETLIGTIFVLIINNLLLPLDKKLSERDKEDEEEK